MLSLDQVLSSKTVSERDMSLLYYMYKSDEVGHFVSTPSPGPL